MRPLKFRSGGPQTSRYLLFRIVLGAAEGKYKDYQERLYEVETDTGKVRRWADTFNGSVREYALIGTEVLAAGNVGTQVQVYAQSGRSGTFRKMAAWSGTYGLLSAALRSSRIACVYSSLQRPVQVYLVESVEKLQEAKRVTAFNIIFTERGLPQGKPYRWEADDGTSIEGMLIYPPGKFAAKNLPMLVLIHGGPEAADGDEFRTGWYQRSAPLQKIVFRSFTARLSLWPKSFA